MDCCCAMRKPAPSTPFRRYRRSTVTKAPRKRTFIANMNKFLIDYQMPSGVSGESFFGASTLCQVPTCRPICQGQGLVAAAPIYETMNGSGGGNGRGRNGAAFSGDDGQGNDAPLSDQMSALPFVVAVALSIALYPALESLAPPVVATAAAVEPQPKAAVEEELMFDSIQHAIDAFMMGEDTECGEVTAEVSEPKLAVHMG